jgi:hypothetical protein
MLDFNLIFTFTGKIRLFIRKIQLMYIPKPFPYQFPFRLQVIPGCLLYCCLQEVVVTNRYIFLKGYDVPVLIVK